MLRAGVLEDGKRIRSGEGTPKAKSRRFWPRSISLRYSICGPSMASEARARDVIVVAFRGRHRVGFHSKADADQFRANYGTNEEDQPGTASRENATSGVWSVCDRPTQGVEKGNRRRSTFLAFTHICAKKRSTDGSRCCGKRSAKVQTELNGGESRTSATDA